MNTLILPNEKANYLRRFWIACFAIVLILFAFNSTSVSAAIVSGVASFKTIGNSNSGNTWLTIGPANSLNSYDTIAKGNDNDFGALISSFPGFNSLIMILPLFLLVAMFLGNAATYIVGITQQNMQMVVFSIILTVILCVTFSVFLSILSGLVSTGQL